MYKNFLIPLICLFASHSIAAPVEYTYTGNSFNLVSDSMVDPSRDHITFSFILAEALPGNIPFATDYSDVFYGLDVLSFSVSDGVVTYTDTDPRQPSIYGQLSTDVDGNIVEWELQANADSIPYMELGDYLFRTKYRPSLIQAPYDEQIYIRDDSTRCREYVSPTSPTCYSDSATAIDVVGTWSVTVVPLPATAWLFGSALFGLGWARWKE